MYYDEAISIFEALKDYNDSTKQAENIQSYLQAIELLNSGDYEAAADLFTALGDFGDSAEQLKGIEELGIYYPYIGEFSCVFDGKERHLSSNFVIENGNVIWEVTMPEGNLMGMGYYFFLSDGNTKRWPVNDNMTVIDAHEEAGTVTVKFENGNIIVTGSGGHIDESDRLDFWNRCYVKVK